MVATPLGVVLSFCMLSNASHVTIRGVCIIMIYMVKKMRVNGEMARENERKVQPTKGVGFRVGFHPDRVDFAALINPALSKV